MAYEKRLEVEAQVVETRFVQGHEIDGLALVRGKGGGRVRDELAQAPRGLARVPGGLRVRDADALLERRQGSVGELRRVVPASAVHEVVRLVDEEDRFGERGRVARRRERDHRVEDVVVVAEDDVGLFGELEGDLERADGLVAGRLEDRVRVEVAVALEEPVEEARGLHLGAVVLRVRAVVLVAQHDVVRAHALFRAEPHGPKGLAVDGGQGLFVDLLLRRLRREDEEAPVPRERADEKGMQGGGRLPDAGRGLDEEMLALCNGVRDGGSHLALAGPEARVREDERRSLGGFCFCEGLFLEERLKEHPRAVHEVLESLLGLVRDVEKLRRARLDVREDEAPVNGPPLGSRYCLHVPAELQLKALEARGSRELREVLGEMQGLDLVHDHAAALFEAAVEAPFEHRGEVIHGVGEPNRPLDRVAGHAREVLAENAPMHRLADPEPFEAVAPVESGPAGDAAEERSGGERDRLRREVDRERHGRL